MSQEVKRRILITGGAGHVGGSLARKLVRDPDNYVVIVDNLSTGDPAKLPGAEYPNWSFEMADVINFGWLTRAVGWKPFDYIFHYAAVVGVQRTQEQPELVLGDIQGIHNVLDLATAHRVKRFFYASSSEVYGEPFEIPQHEDTTPLNSRLPYAIVKNVGESYARTYFQSEGIPYTIMRLFNTYGPLQSTDFVVSRFLERIRQGEPITLYGDGQQTRTFCHVDDHVAAVERMLYDGLARNAVINIGSDEEVTVEELAKRMIAVTGADVPIQHAPALKAGDMRRRCPEISFLREVLGRAPMSFEKGFARLLGQLEEASNRAPAQPARPGAAARERARRSGATVLQA